MIIREVIRSKPFFLEYRCVSLIFMNFVCTVLININKSIYIATTKCKGIKLTLN